MFPDAVKDLFTSVTFVNTRNPVVYDHMTNTQNAHAFNSTIMYAYYLKK